MRKRSWLLTWRKALTISTNKLVKVNEKRKKLVDVFVLEGVHNV